MHTFRPAAAFAPRPAFPSTRTYLPLSALLLWLGFASACGSAALREPGTVGSGAQPEAGGPVPPEPVAAAADASRTEGRESLVLFASADMQGSLEPCGCVGGQYGGLPRRASYLRSARRPGDVYIDLGGLVSSDTALQASILEASLEALRAKECDALVPGEAELRFGGRFVELARRLGPPLVCANLRWRADGALVFPATRLCELPDGRRIAIVGVTSPAGSVGPDLVVDPPAEAARTAVASLGPEVAAVVVAASASGPEARQIATEVGGIALIVAARAGIDSPALEAAPGAPVALAGRFGEFLVRVGFDENLAVVAGRRQWIGADLAAAPDVAAIVARHRERVAAANRDLPRRLATEFAAAGAVGSATCRACHSREFETWAESVHARAESLLDARGARRDPSCLPCHLRDTHAEGLDAGSAPGGVGCEACHGPSRRHVESAARDRETSERPERTPGVTEAACRACHDARHSPAFDFDAYVRRVTHRN